MYARDSRSVYLRSGRENPDIKGPLDFRGLDDTCCIGIQMVAEWPTERGRPVRREPDSAEHLHRAAGNRNHSAPPERSETPIIAQDEWAHAFVFHILRG